MQSINKTVKELIENNWSLTDKDTKASVITFRQGRTIKTKTKFQPHDIIIQVYSESGGARPRNLGRTHFTRMIAIDIIQKVPSLEPERVEADDIQQALMDEVKRIIKANQHRVGDIEMKVFTGDTFIPNLEDNPPYLRVIINIGCKYNV
jgi:hypothetical protein